MATPFPDLAQIHARYRPVDQRVDGLLQWIRQGCDRRPGESHNRANERHVEEFIESLKGAYPGRTYEVSRGPRRRPVSPADGERWSAAREVPGSTVVIERQRLSRWALRTTRFNYLFTVPGETEETLLLVAHYDTWRGPGADDNTTGEEILKQYLLADLDAARPPRLTHVYFLAGSEECGLVGLMSQVLLASALLAATFALTYHEWLYLAIALGLCPLASYRFGVSGSREYVRTLSIGELTRLRAVISVDSVGEGRMYIPRSTLGATFIRALIPFGDYDSLNDLLEEAAHLHGIKYNNYISGGTTDHVSFLEVNNGLWHRLRDGMHRLVARVTRRPLASPLRIPASALIAMAPGKASPLVYGGKIHTPQDVPERVYREPLGAALLILDYVFYRFEGGARPREPRKLHEYHYARLYRSGGEYWLAFKDAVEPNRRNLNGVYRADVTVEGDRAAARVGALIGWGVEQRLRDQVAAVALEHGRRFERVPIEELEIAGQGRRLRYARRRTLRHRVERLARRATAGLERFMGRYSFLVFLAAAYGIAEIGSWVLYFLLRYWEGFVAWFTRYEVGVEVLIVVLQLALTVFFMVKLLPTWVDNSYRHENRADNLGSLRRVAA